MKKKIMKSIVFIASIVLILSVASTSFAASTPAGLKSGISNANVTEFDAVGERIVGGIQAIGTIISVGVLIVLGIKYMMGSAEEKAEYKKTMMPYLIGAVLLFAATNLAGMIYNFATTIS